MSTRIVVVFPAPFGPRNPKTVAVGTERSRSTMPRADPYDFVRASVSMASMAHLRVWDWARVGSGACGIGRVWDRA
ncbi:MAG: hypothetical protein WD271_12225 [Acidimicrobiia bacterium]